MADISIRNADPADVSRVRGVIRLAYASWADRLPDLPDVSGGVEDEIAAGRVWVATEGRGIVGCLIGGVDDGVWHVANVAVAPDQAGKGCGSALMQHAVELARRAGVGQMALATHVDMARNVVMYERLGWEVSNRDGNRIMMHRDTDA